MQIDSLRTLLVFLFTIVLNTIFINKVSGQTTTVPVDLSAKADTSVTISGFQRQGDACAGSNCIIFNITVNPGSDLINFNASQLTGASFYSINCGPQIPIGTPACISGLTSVQISFCKPGGNLVDYYITAVTNVKASADLTLRQGCTGTMSVTGLNAASTTWTSIFPGARGTHNSYLSQTSGATSVNVTPQIGSPAFIDYEVSGNQTTTCIGVKSDTVRVYTTPALSVTISPLNPAICPGTGTVLTANVSGGNPTYTYFWSTGATSQSISVNTAGTYSVSVMDNTTGCAAVVQQVTVAAVSPPSAPTALGATICSGSSAVLTATGPGGTYEWYNAASGGTLLSTGANFNTPVLTANTTYYVQTILGCTSSRTPVTVSVTPIPAAPTASNITICSGSAGVLTATSPGGTYQWFDAPSGGTLLATGANFTTPVLTSGATYYVQTTVSGCTSSRTAVTVNITPLPPAPTTTSATICEGNAASVSATAPGGTYQWYSVASGGTILATGSTFTSPVLTTTTTYYVEAIVNGCTGPRTAATINVIPLVDPEFEYSSGTYCKSGGAFTPAPFIYTGSGGTFTGSAGLVINDTTGVIDVIASAIGTYTVTFTNNSPCPRSTFANVTITNAPIATFSYGGPYCILDNNPLPSFPTGASAGIFSSSAGLVFISESTGEINLSASTPGTYLITNTIDASGCALTVDTFSVKINPAPLAPTVQPVSICSGTTTILTATDPGGTYQWYASPSGGTSIGTGASLTTPILFATTTYYVETTVNGCTGPRAAVIVTVNPIPAAPTALGTTVCSGTTASLTAIAPGGTYQWYDAVSGGNLLGTGAIYTTSILTATTTYYVQTTINGCISSRSPVTVNVTPIPSAPVASGAGICSGTTATLNASGSSGTYEWYDALSGGNLLVVNSSFTTPNLTSNATYYVQTTVNGCTSLRTAVTVTVSPQTAAPFATGETICAGNSVVLAAGSVIGATYQWYDASTGGNLIGSASAFTTPVLTSNTTYYVQATVNGCASPRTAVIVIVIPLPAAPTVSSASTLPICPGGNTTITASAPGGIYHWYDAPSGGNLLATGSSFTSPILMLTTTYYVQATINGCIGPRTAATISVYPIINPEFQYSSGTYCKSGTTFTPAPDTFTSGGGTFSASAGLIIDPLTGVIDVSLSPIGTYSVTFTNNSPCPKSTSVNVTITNAPDATFEYSGPFCLKGNDPLPIFKNGASAGIFSVSSTGLVFVSTSTGQINLSASAAGNYTITNTIAASGSCTESVHTYNITILTLPPAPAVTSATICEGNVAILTASASSGIYQWYDAPAGGNLIATGPQFTGQLFSTTTYYVGNLLNGCTGPRTAATITVIPLLDPEFKYSSGTYCKSGGVASPPPVIYTTGGGTFSASPGLVINSISGVIDIRNSITGTHTITFTNNSPCPRSTSAKITITNAPDATFTYNGPLCLSGINPLPVFAGGASAGIFSASSPDLVFVNSSAGEIDLSLSKAGTYTITNSIAATGNCASASASTVLTIYPLPPAPTVPVPTICAGTQATFSALAPGGIYQWFDSASGGKLLGTGPFYTTPVLTVSTTFYVQTIFNGCISPRTAARAIVIPVPDTPVAGSNSPVCTGNSVFLSTASVEGASYYWTGPNGFSSTEQNPVITNARTADAGSYIVMITQNGCASLPGSVEVIINALPVVNAGSDQKVCISTATIKLSGTIGGSSVSARWSSTGTGTFLPSNTRLNATYQPSETDKTLPQLTFTLTSVNNSACTPVTSSMNVAFQSLPVVNAGRDQVVCANNPVIQLSGNVSGAISGMWTSSGTGKFIPSNTALNAVYVPSESDILNQSVGLTLISIGNGACSLVSDNILLTINPIPVVDLGNDKAILEKTTIVLQPKTIEQDSKYIWLPNSGLSDNTTRNPVFSGTESQTFILTITNKFGCSSTDTISVKVLKPIRIPNTFTPNSDGINDSWNIDQLKEYPGASVKVYNRYGVQLYNSLGYPQPWDGSYKGETLSDGVYYYIIDTKFPGQVFSGSITILR